MKLGAIRRRRGCGGFPAAAPEDSPCQETAVTLQRKEHVPGYRCGARALGGHIRRSRRFGAHSGSSGPALLVRGLLERGPGPQSQRLFQSGQAGIGTDLARASRNRSDGLTEQLRVDGRPELVSSGKGHGRLVAECLPQPRDTRAQHARGDSEHLSQSLGTHPIRRVQREHRQEPTLSHAGQLNRMTILLACSRTRGNGMTRGDRKRNARRERLRGLLPRDGVVVGIGLAEDKQALAVVDHDVRVLARKTVRVKAFRLGEALDFACTLARHFPPGLVVLRAQSRLRLEGRTRTLSRPFPDLSPSRVLTPPQPRRVSFQT
jgi:hypothetical protein